jgi:hypothetical protein
MSRVDASSDVPSPGAEEGGHAAKPALDGLRFHDQSRFRSAEVTRVFTSAIRAVSHGAQSEVAEPDELTLEPEGAISDQEIVRGVD